MGNSYLEYIKANFEFPQEGFSLKNDQLSFHGVSIIDLIEKYSTPFKLMYLPKIGEQINNARSWFGAAIERHNYTGKYHYAYCTKCCHYAPVVKAAAKEGVQFETSSSLDVDLIYQLLETGDLSKSTTILHNGYKTDDYLKKIIQLKQDGFEHSILILDSKSELQRAIRFSNYTKIKIGIRMAVEEPFKKSYSTSRLGIPKSEIIDFYKSQIEGNSNVELTMFHFFVDGGIKDSEDYWNIFNNAIDTFISLKKICPSLDSINIGGGFPVKNDLSSSYNYVGIVDKIIGHIKSACSKVDIEDPDIYTEFGKYTIGECGANIFTALEQKNQNNERWYMVDNSLINTIPDAWTIDERFIVLPINKWSHKPVPVHIGGISCDDADYYGSNDSEDSIHLPEYDSQTDEPLYIGFFHTGAYQDAISGYGGVKHCLIPDPKLIFVNRDEDGNLFDYEHGHHLTATDKLKILGY